MKKKTNADAELDRIFSHFLNTRKKKPVFTMVNQECFHCEWYTHGKCGNEECDLYEKESAEW